MNNAQRHDPGGERAATPGYLGGLDLDLLGWRAVEQRERTHLWQDVDGDFLGLVRVDGVPGLPPLGDADAVERHCRTMAESMEAHLVEASVLDGRAVMFICRRLDNVALTFTGVLTIPTPAASWIWSMVAKGRPVTGDVRYLCDDCLCQGHPLWRVRHELPKLIRVRLDA